MNNNIISDIKLLDDVIIEIKLADKRKSFSPKGLEKFEFIFFQSLNIVRYELQTDGEISDLSGEAITQLFVFQTFEYYKTDFPEIYVKCSNLFERLITYNTRLRSNNLGAIGAKDENWVKYFNKIFKKILINKAHPPAL